MQWSKFKKFGRNNEVAVRRGYTVTNALTHRQNAPIEF